MTTVKMHGKAGDFGENKDTAKLIRIEKIMPALARGQTIQLDFTGMTGTTQSFIHALIAEPIREFPDTFFDLVVFKACNDLIKTVIGIVSEYMQESLRD